MQLDTQVEKRERMLEGLSVEKAHDAREGFSIAFNFLKELNTKYPDYDFPNEFLMNAFNPEKKTKRVAISYAAKASGETVGMLTGEQRGDGLYAIAFIVDPKFQNTDVAPRLIAEIQHDFDSIQFTPASLGGKENRAQNFSKPRQDALVKYYKKYGFEETDTGLMTWNKKKENI